MRKRAGTAAPFGTAIAEDEPDHAPPAEGQDDRQFVVALARGLEILRAFSPAEPLLGNQEIAAYTGLPKPTVSRLTYTLTQLGYLTYSERLGKYRLGAPVLSLGYAVLSGMSIRQVARPYMQELADYSNVAVSIGSRDRLSVVYVEHCRSNATVVLRLDVGSRIPLATTAMGRALLAGMPEAERAEILEQLRDREPALWPRIQAGIDQALDDFHHRGFTLSMGDWQPDVHAVGVPFAPADGSGLLAFNCGGPSFLLSRDKLINDLGPRLAAMVRTIGAATGGTG